MNDMKNDYLYYNNYYDEPPPPPPSTEKLIYFVAVDTRGLHPTDLHDGFVELACPESCFINNVVKNPYTKSVTCPLAESCGLSKHLKLYFNDYYLGEGSPLSPSSSFQDDDVEHVDKEVAWSEYFAFGHNNPAATLLTMDHSTGYARYNVQGVAYALYDEGRYPISKEQVWGLCEMTNAAKDVYFAGNTLYKTKKRAGPLTLSKWCSSYRKRQWGPPQVYRPRSNAPEATGEDCPWFPC